MAGRIRTIKPELLEDERVAELSANSFRLFIGCILLADDYGNLRGSTGYLTGAVFWRQIELGHIDVLEIARARDELIASGLVRAYRVRGQVYIHVTGWEKHQRVDRPGQPRAPSPSDPDAGPVSSDSASLREIREGLADATRLTGTSTSTPTSTNDQEKDPSSNVSGSVDPGSSSPTSESLPEPIGSTTSSPSPTLELLPTEPNEPAIETQVFDRYLEGWHRVVRGRRPPRLDPKRRKLIKARLAEGFLLDDLKAACDGLWASTWHVENGQTDFGLVMRDTAHVERFIQVRSKQTPQIVVRPNGPPSLPPMLPIVQEAVDRGLAALAGGAKVGPKEALEAMKRIGRGSS